MNFFEFRSFIAQTEQNGNLPARDVPVTLDSPLRLPPPYRLATLREHGDAFAHACDVAREAGAGTLVRVRRFDLVEFAVVLEPEEPLKSARRAFFAGMTAFADAVASCSPPEKPLAFVWPDTLQYDGARLGGGRLGWPADCPEDRVPDWLVFAAMLIASKHRFGEPGLTPDSTSLEDEGFEADAETLIESFARHLMTAFDAWAEQGFEAVARSYLARLPRRRGEGLRAIEPNGDLLVHREAGAPERVALRPALLRPSWLDPATGMPRL